MTHYPDHLITHLKLSSGEDITIRPSRLEDADLILDFFRQLSSRAKHELFMETFSELSQDMLTRLTRVDYQHDLVLLATLMDHNKETLIGISRFVTTSYPEECEFSLIVGDDWQNTDAGSALMHALIHGAEHQHLSSMKGILLASNIQTMRLLEELGFEIKNSDDPTVKLTIKSLS